MRLMQEEVPSFNMKFSFQSNMAFMLAVFLLSCALGWSVRDHRRRQMELVSEEKEDKLYLNTLLVLFSVCILGSYFSFNRTKIDPGSGLPTTGNVLLEELWSGLKGMQRHLDKRSRTWPPYEPGRPVAMPIPDRALFDLKVKENADDAETHYSALGLVVSFLLALLGLWYFFPKPRQEIQPPREYCCPPLAGRRSGVTGSGPAFPTADDGRRSSRGRTEGTAGRRSKTRSSKKSASGSKSRVGSGSGGSGSGKTPSSKEDSGKTGGGAADTAA